MAGVFTRPFWEDTAERVVATAAQAALAVWTADGLDVLQLNFAEILAVGGLGGVYAFLKALAAQHVGDASSASLLPSVGTHPRS